MVPRSSVFARTIAVTLTALIVAGPSWANSAAEGAVALVGGLSVETDPVGAAVYVDGRPAGETPVKVSGLPAGEHRVRIVKSGYLENARLISVAAGKPTALKVNLTRSGETSTAAGQVTSTGGGGGGSKKWLWIAVAGGAAAAVAVAAMPKNKAPVPGSVSGPANALMATNVSFTAQGVSDPDGDSLTITWSFGDGGTATGTTVTHAFTTAGSFPVSYKVSDGKKEATSPNSTITVKSMAGTWRGNLVGTSTFNTVLNLSQNGATITGTYTDSQVTPVVGAGAISAGSVDPATGRVSFTVTVPGFAPFTFVGTPSSDVNTVNGAANGSGFTNATWNITRS
jgi:hypothetical protein